MKNSNLKNLVLAAMLLALGLVLPFVTGQLKQIGHMLLPMHIPVLLCGLICGKYHGLAIGLIMPVLRSILFARPAMFPDAVSMAFELATYGFAVGLLYSVARWRCVRMLYRSLVLAMLSGRLVWGVVQCFILGVGANGFTFSAFLTRAFVNGIPGIAIQLVLIPAIMVALGRARMIPFGRDNEAAESD